MEKTDTGWQKDFMQLLNDYIDDLKNKPEYKTAKDILNINKDSKYVIHRDMFEYTNKKREDTKEQNVLISETKKIGKKILKEDKKGYSNYERLYNSLNKHPKFKKFFEQNELKRGDMYDFGEHIAEFKTKSMEQHEKHNAKQQAAKQQTQKEIETLKGENKKKDEKIARRDKRIEKRDKKLEELLEASKQKQKEIENLQKHINAMQETLDKKHDDEEYARLKKKVIEDKIEAKYKDKKEKIEKKYEYVKTNAMRSLYVNGPVLDIDREMKNKIYELEQQYNNGEIEKDKYLDEVSKIKLEYGKAKIDTKNKLTAEFEEKQNEYYKEIGKIDMAIKEELENSEAYKKYEELQNEIYKLSDQIKAGQEQINILNTQIEDERKQAEEDKRNIKAEANRDKNEKIAQIKHKMEERHGKDMEEKLKEYQTNQKEIYGFAPNLEAYIKKKLASKAYSLDEDELIDKISRDIGKPGGLPTGTDPKLVAKAIYDRGAEETLKHIKKIANLAILTGYNNDLYNKLPGDVAQEVQKYITDKINDDIRKKNIKYILPKDKPRWEYAMQTKNLNPMLGRSAWRVN